MKDELFILTGVSPPAFSGLRGVEDVGETLLMQLNQKVLVEALDLDLQCHGMEGVSYCTPSLHVMRK